MNHLPKISVVTPSYNQGPFIEETILSVVRQDYPSIEFIVMDGGSTDNSVDILQKYEKEISFWESKPDNGQADALNKGFARATGDICCYLNSDDCFYPGAFQHVAEIFNQSNPVWLATSTIVSEQPHLHTRTWRPNQANFPFFVNQQTFAQQGVFWKNEALPKPYFNSDFFYAMDHDFFCRLYEKYGPPHVSTVVTSFFRVQENSKTAQFNDRLVADMKKTRIRYLDKVDTKTGDEITMEFSRLEAIRLLQDKLTRREAINLDEFSGLIRNTPFKFRDRQFFSLLIRVLAKSF